MKLRAAWLLFAAASSFASPAAGAELDAEARQLSRDLFRQLIEINTTDSVGDNTAAARAMQRRFLDAGFEPKDVQLLIPEKRLNKGNLVVRLHGRPDSALKPVLILAHLDVVEAKREDWTTDPFQFVEKDGYFYGRGTQDMKDFDAIVVATLLRFKQERFVPSRDIILALTSDEEGGTANGVDWLLKNHRDLLDAAFVLNPDAGGVFTEKGKPVSVEVGAAEKIYADFQLTVTNSGGHSSLPVPDNAIYHLADALANIERSPFPIEINPVVRDYFTRLAARQTGQAAADLRAVLSTPPDEAAAARLGGDPRRNALMRTTCVPTRLSGGHANNALPQTAQAVVNCRILPGNSPEEIRRKLVGIVGDPKVSVTWIDGKDNTVHETAPEGKGLLPPAPLPEIVKPLETVADSLWPGAPVLFVMQTGASDSKYTQALGIPSYGVGEVAIERDDQRAHGKDERLRVSSYYEAVDFFYRYLKLVTR